MAPRLTAWAIVAAGILAAAGVVALQSLVFHASWVAKSQITPPEGLLGGTQWGGSTVARTAPPRMFFDNDSYYWIAYTRQMIDTPTLRVRATDLDNAPYGREVHWSSVFAWWIATLAGPVAALRGTPWREGLEIAALFANPLLFVLLLVPFAWWIAARLGPVPAAVSTLAVALLPPLLWDFAYGRPDHHGLHDFTALGLLMCLVLGGAGWIARSPAQAGFWLPREQARRWFIASGIFGGLGLWVGATQQSMIIAAAGLGGLAVMLLARRRVGPAAGGHAAADAPDGLVYDPSLWQVWGIAGGLTSLAAYLIEYAPGHLFGMRLEVNGPLPALAFVCGGVLLARLGRAILSGEPRDAVRPENLAFLAGALAYPLAVVFGPPEWHSLRDPQMRRLHDYIAEFQPLFDGSLGRVWEAFVKFGLFAVLPLPAAWLAFRRTTPPAAAAVVVVLLPAIAVLAAWTLVQARWAGLLAAALVALLLAVMGIWRVAGEAAAARESGVGESSWFPLRRVWLAGLGLLVAFEIFAVAVPWSLALLGRQQGIDPQLAAAIATRDVALNLARYTPALGRVRVMSGPSETPTLHHVGDLRGTGALYWENGAGVRDTVAFFADYGDEEARRIAAARGIHFVIAPESPELAEWTHWCLHGDKDPKKLEKTLAWRLGSVKGDVPDWLEPVPHYASPMANSYGLRLYRVRLGTGQLNPAQ